MWFTKLHVYMNNLQRSWHDANFDVCEKVNKELYGIWQPANIDSDGVT